jgi:hypothetical protein
MLMIMKAWWLNLCKHQLRLARAAGRLPLGARHVSGRTGDALLSAVDGIGRMFSTSATALPSPCR